MKTIIALLIGALLSGLSACSPNERKPPQAQTSIARYEVIHKSLYFTGIIAPIRISTVTSPMDSVIERMNYAYGQRVKKGDVIAVLDSMELQRQYNETLTEYLKAKDSFSVARAKFTGTKNLWDAGLLSKNNFMSEKSNLDTARISFMQATRKLTEMLEKTNDSNLKSLSGLRLAEFEKVRQVLSGNHNLIQLKAPFAGVLLYPPKANDDKTGTLTVGSSVKAGQSFAMIGDLSGIRVEIDVPEIDIEKIHPGMKAMITGIALGKETLQGELIAINAQATASVGNALPSFSAVVAVKTLTEPQKQRIKAGMSAAIELMVDGDKQLFIPIAAVRLEKGASMVRVKERNGAIVSRRVLTGAAAVEKVVIESGLKEGDVVVYGE